MARGAIAPSILPVWQRALLLAKDSPKVTYIHHEYDQVDDTKGITIPLASMANRSFFFGPTEISTIRKTLPTHLSHCSSLELLSAYIWRLRIIALQLNLEEEVSFLCLLNLRSKFNFLPLGYYGNAFAFSKALTTSDKLCGNPWSYAIELVKKAKASMTEEYMKSVADLRVIKNRPFLNSLRSFTISDLRRFGLEEVDYGWGKATYGGPGLGGARMITNFVSYFIPFKNRKGEKGVLVHLCLPIPSMERFVARLDALLEEKQLADEVEDHKRTTIGGETTSL